MKLDVLVREVRRLMETLAQYERAIACEADPVWRERLRRHWNWDHSILTGYQANIRRAVLGTVT
jgi:hypothetical protein